MFSYHHWDEDEESLDEDGNKWNWYFVSMYDMFTEDPLANPWPVFAEGFEQAMDVYEVLYRDAVNRENQVGDLD